MAYKRVLTFLAICYLVGATWAETLASQNQQQNNGTVVSSGVVLSADGSIKSNISLPPVFKSTELPLLQKAAAESKCVCDGSLVSRVDENGKSVEICPSCKCKYVARNTTLIKVVVIIVIFIISILVIYMLFLICLDPLLNKRVKANYQEHTNEDDDTTTTPPMPSSTQQELNSRANVLNRVGHQQTKWKRQVREQRRHIYDRRTMLN